MNEKIAWLMTYCGSGTAFICSFDLNTVVAVLSLLIALAGLFMSWYYAARKDRRELLEHQLRDSRDRNRDVREEQREQREQEKAP